MKTTLKGGRIPLSKVYSEAGVIRAPGCTYLPTAPGWFCPSSTGIEYWDVVYEMMDEDHFKRRLSPLAVRGTGGYLDIINGPTDHTCCIGYACSMRLQTYHTTVACGKEFDYYFTSTIPVEGRFHFPHAPPECKIKIALYTKKPNRIDIFADEKFIPPTNSQMKGGKIEWFKPNDAYIPQLATHTSGANYHQRDQQLVHFIATGGSVYRLKVVQTLVLELGVMTELTEDQFYDNGNLAGNIAALLGIDEDKIRVMNVISESSSRRRRRHTEEEFEVISIAANRFRREEGNSDTEEETEESGPELKSIQFEIEPEIDNNIGAENLDKIAAKIVENPSVVAETIVETLKAIDPTVESDQLLAVAAPPKAPEEPEPPVTLAEQLGVDEFESADPDDLDDFIESLNDAAGFDITQLPTAIEKQEEEQAAADEAADLVVYQTPVKMIFKQVISSPSQVLGQKLIEPFVLSMLDADGNHINNVGYVEKPWKVKVQLFEPKLASKDDGEVDYDDEDKKKPFKMVTIEGSISTSYDFSDVQDDTTASYASIKADTEAELASLIETDQNIKTAKVTVTGFTAANDSRRKRESSEQDSSKAIAIFSVECEVIPSKMMTVEDLESSVDSTITNADASDFESFNDVSFSSMSITVSIVEPIKPTKDPFEEGSGENEGSGVDEGSGIDEGSGSHEGSGSDEGSGESETYDGFEILEELHRRRRDEDGEVSDESESENDTADDEIDGEATNDVSKDQDENESDDKDSESSDEKSEDESKDKSDDKSDDESDAKSNEEPEEVEEPETPSLDGETVVEFTPGSGLAIFDNLVFKGDLASTRLKFSITFPSDVEIESLITEMEIVFVPEMEAECVVEEGGGFDRKLSFTEGCTKVCMAPCSDLTVGMVTCNKMKTCSGTEEGGETFGVCEVDNDGLSMCTCDMDSVPRVNNLNAKEYLSVQCDAGSLEIRVNKCAMNKYGFSLTELFLHGPDRLTANEVDELLLASAEAEDEEGSGSSSNDSAEDGLKATEINDCRGQIAFDNGPEYVFKIDRRLSDCNTKMEPSDGNKELGHLHLHPRLYNSSRLKMTL